MVDNFVYQNGSSSTIGVGVTVNIETMGDWVDIYTGDYKLEIASAGTLGAGGVLTGALVIDRHRMAFAAATLDNAVTGSVTKTLFGFIPTNWYYRLAGSFGLKATGTVLQTTYYLPR